MKVTRVVAPVREQAVALIRESIVRGELHPGQRLIEREMCESLDVSRNTLREAYRQLETEGFLDIRPHKGPVVATMTNEEARQVYAMREALECFAIREFTINASDEQVRELARLAEETAAAISTVDPLELLESKNGFYDVLFEGADNVFMRDQARLLYARLAAFRLRSLNKPGRAAQSAEEICAIVDRVVARDHETAATLWREHVRNAAAAALDENRVSTTT